MEFKIDTKEYYTSIAPLATGAEAAFADKLSGIVEAAGQNGSKNYVIDLQGVASLAVAEVSGLLDLHISCYTAGQSLVFTGMNAEVAEALKQGDEDRLLNVAPTLIEALDIINMEMLERDLMSEE
ncbi:MAG: STAS domain-containing protein [Chitinophagia bacterium]|nr:STAS domain-containing protein [Chitinophagia bacterium]